LSKDKNKDVRCSVAENPNTPVETLEKLSHDYDWVVNSSVAKNPNTSPETLEKLSHDYGHEYIVRLEVAENPSTPVETLKKLSNDEHNYVSAQAKKMLKKRGIDPEKQFTFDITKLSPELREKVKDWDAEDIAKFIGWLKKQKEEGEA